MGFPPVCIGAAILVSSVSMARSEVTCESEIRSWLDEYDTELRVAGYDGAYSSDFDILDYWDVSTATYRELGNSIEAGRKARISGLKATETLIECIRINAKSSLLPDDLAESIVAFDQQFPSARRSDIRILANAQQ